ncbi:MAG: DNA N-6-adenine-methyltransferase [Candidatus Tyrphobacter sp.]
MLRYKVPVVLVVDKNGSDVDGTARAAVAKEIGTEVIVHTLENSDALAWYHLNCAGRRDFSTGQLAMTIVMDDKAMNDVSELTQREQNQLLAQAIGTESTTYITYARYLRKIDSKLIAGVLTGEPGLQSAYDQEKGKASDHNRSGGDRWNEEKNGENDRRYSPDAIRKAVHDVFNGDFLDAASEYLSDGTNPMKAPRIFTKDDKGEEQPWEPRTFVNCPFSKKSIWIDKCIEEKEKGNGSYCVLPDDTSTVAFHKAVEHAVDFLFFQGRVNYGVPADVLEKRRIEGKSAGDGNVDFNTWIFGFGISVVPLAEALRAQGLRCVVLPGHGRYKKLAPALSELEEQANAPEWTPEMFEIADQLFEVAA